MSEIKENSIITRLPLEVWKIIFNEFSAKELWKTCSTSRYWSYLTINILVSRLKKKPLDVCRFYGDFLQPSSEPFITCIPFSSSGVNFSFDDYLIHIKQPQPIILGQWVSRSVGFVPWCQQESNNNNSNNKNNTHSIQNYETKNNLKYYAEKPPTIYCWFCSPYNVDKEIAELGNVSSMYDLPKIENGLYSNKSCYYESCYNYNFNQINYYNSSYSHSRSYYNNSTSYTTLPSSRSNNRCERNYNSISYNSYNNYSYGENNYNNNSRGNNYRSSMYTNDPQYQRIKSYEYKYNNDFTNIEKCKTNENEKVDIYEISIGKGMAKLKYELVNIEENASINNTSNPSRQQSYNNSNRNKDDDYIRNKYKSSSIEGNCKMSIKDFIGEINKSFDVVSSKNPQGNYSNLIMDYYNPNLVTYDNMSPNPRNYNLNNNKPDTIIEVKIIELILHPSAIFS